MLRLRKN
ncbi:hypothetical protein ACMD2_26077 [Ananas comosus]|nr:hypothetical protein ACMD2_26077 [Ananas comosus]